MFTKLVTHSSNSMAILHRIVGLYYYGFLVNEGIGLILVIQTFYPFTLSVLYNKDVYQPLLLYDPLHFLLIYLSHIKLHKTVSYHSYSRYLFTLLILKFIYIFMYITMCLYIMH